MRHTDAMHQHDTWSVLVPRSPHLKLMAADRQTDWIRKRSTHMVNYVTAPQVRGTYSSRMTLYHEAPLDSLSELRHNGLERTARGDKGDDPVIKRTDDYLDAHCPDKLRSYGVSRSNNLYAFLGDEAHIVDIQNGATLPLQDYAISDSILFRLSVDPASCFVSDLDRYDAVKAAVASHDTPNYPTLLVATGML